MIDALAIVMRWLHLASVATLIGGLLYAPRVYNAAARVDTPEALAKFGDEAVRLFRRGVLQVADIAAMRYRMVVYAAIVCLVASGTYNLLTTPGHSVRYKILLAIKLLLVAHVFAVAILAVQPKNDRRARMMAGGGISGLVIILISAYLRRIF